MRRSGRRSDLVAFLSGTRTPDAPAGTRRILLVALLGRSRSLLRDADGRRKRIEGNARRILLGGFPLGTVEALAAGAAPSLLTSAIPLDAEAFRAVLIDGALKPNGMPSFEPMAPDELEALRHYVRQRAREEKAAGG